MRIPASLEFAGIKAQSAGRKRGGGNFYAVRGTLEAYPRKTWSRSYQRTGRDGADLLFCFSRHIYTFRGADIHIYNQTTLERKKEKKKDDFE